MLLFNADRQDRCSERRYISKHLMLLFNICGKAAINCGIAISKHLMLLFNEAEEKEFYRLVDFKTSHVIV